MLLSSLLYRTSGDLNLSSNTGLDRLLAEDEIGLGANGIRTAVGLPKLSPTEVDMSTRNTTVKFEDGSDDESINGTESESTGFVRHNTPHPRDLKAKFQKWFGGSKPKSKNTDKGFAASDENENSKGPFRPERHQAGSNEPYSHLQQHKQDQIVFEQNAAEMIEAPTDSSEQEETEGETDEQDVKHVGFEVERIVEAEEEEEQEERLNLRLHRRDTPHHLKNKRINPGAADPDTIKAILERVQQKPPQTETEVKTPSTISKEDSIDSVIRNPSFRELELTLNRDAGQPFGLNIAGGLGSSPFVDNDQSIFVSKVVPSGLADAAGLHAGDRVVKVNGVDFTNIDHREAVEAIRKAGNMIIFTVERKIMHPNGSKEENISPCEFRPSESSTQIGSRIGNQEEIPRSNEPSSSGNMEKRSVTPSFEPVPTVPPASPSPNLVFPCPKPYKGMSSFDSMIPSEVKNPSAVVTVTIKQPDAISSRVPDIFPAAPTDLGTVTEVITKSTLTETVFTRVTHNEAVMAPVLTEPLVIEKTCDESLGVKIVSGTEEDCFPFGFSNNPGVYVVHVTKHGPAGRAGLKIGHRILEINGRMVDPTDKNKIAMSLLEAGNNIELKVRKHAPPQGFMEVDLQRGEGEPLGMHIKGGLDNPGNPLDKDDSGIFISKILPNGAVHRNALPRVGMRILSVNGNPLLNVTHNEAVNVLRTAGSEIEMILANGYDPNEVDQLRAEGKLPDKIVEILSNSEEAAAATAQYSKDISDISAKPSVDEVMEVVKAAEQLVVPSSPNFSKERAIAVPGSPSHDVKKTTIVMTGHSKTSPGLGEPKRFNFTEKDRHDTTSDHLEPKPRTHVASHETATYANLHDFNNFDGMGSSDEVELEFIDRSEISNEEKRRTNGELYEGVGVEARNPFFNSNQSQDLGLPPLKKNPPTNLSLQRHTKLDESREAIESAHPIPTPRTSLSSIGGGRISPTLSEEPQEIKVKITDLSSNTVSANLNCGSTEVFDADGTQAIFQFSPEFHRVPSPIFNTPHVTFIAPEERRNLSENELEESGNIRVISETYEPALSEPVLDGRRPDIEEETQQNTGGSVRNNMVTARAKFFEQEIQHHQQPVVKAPIKQFSFLSQYEVDRMMQEEERKISAMGSMDYLRSNELEQVLEEEEDYCDDELASTNQTSVETENDIIGSQDDADTVAITDENGAHGNAASRASGNVRSISASSMSSVSSTSSVRTAKAERRLKERLGNEGSHYSDVPSNDLSPSEQRALQAEKRAAWRQARLKSLEQDALQAQMVLNRISEIVDSPSSNANYSPSNIRSAPDKLDNATSTDPDPENNVSIKYPTRLGSSCRSTATSKISSSQSNERIQSDTSTSSTLTSVHFPSLYIRRRSAGPRKITGERERVLGEKVSRKTEEWFNEETGTVEIRTVEIVEKIIEHEVETTEQKIISIELDGPVSPSTDEGNSNPSTPSGINSSKRKKRKNSKKK